MADTYNKLQPEQQDMLLNLFASRHTVEYIKNFFFDWCEIDLSDNMVNYYRYKYREAIYERRTNLMRSVPICDRAYRQLCRQMLIDNILNQERLWREERDKNGDVVMKGNHTAVNQILDSAAKDQDDFVESSDSTVLQFKAMLQLRGEAALKYLKTGILPSLEEMRRLQAGQDQRSQSEKE